MKAFVNDRTAHAHVSKGTVCNFKRSYLRYDRFNATDDLKRSIIFTGLSFISLSKYSLCSLCKYPYVFYSYVYILYLFFIQQSVKKFFFFFSIILVTRSSHVCKSHTFKPSLTAQNRIFATTVLQFLLHASSKPSLG